MCLLFYLLSNPRGLKPEKTPAIVRLCGLSRTKHNKQRQRLNLYWNFIQMASDLRRWRVHTLTDYLTFSFQGSVFVTGNKQGVARGFEIQGKFGERRLQHSRQGQLAVPRAGGHLSLPGT